MNIDPAPKTCYTSYVVILHYTGEFNEIGHLSGRGPSFGVAV